MLGVVVLFPNANRLGGTMSKWKQGLWLVVAGVLLINVVWFITPEQFQEQDLYTNPSNWVGLGNWIGFGGIVAGVVLLLKNPK